MLIKSQLANILTSSRIVFSIVLLFAKIFSPLFYIFYILCGVTDMVDGTVARKTNSASKSGERLDSVADFIFVIVCVVKIFPAIHLHFYLWIWIGVIALIKIVNLVLGLSSKKKNIFLHTVANKITGFLTFVLQLTIQIVSINYSSIPVYAVATFAAVQEFYIIRRK
ncbi:MAG: CDP-alcohol phosphatidyltransferase family protein [Treponema sp.]